jgi:hypothetical protein
MQSSRMEPNLISSYAGFMALGLLSFLRTAFGDGHDNVHALAEDHQ